MKESCICNEHGEILQTYRKASPLYKRQVEVDEKQASGAKIEQSQITVSLRGNSYRLITNKRDQETDTCFLPLSLVLINTF